MHWSAQGLEAQLTALHGFTNLIQGDADQTTQVRGPGGGVRACKSCQDGLCDIFKCVRRITRWMKSKIEDYT